jgi:hypothetical protein
MTRVSDWNECQHDWEAVGDLDLGDVAGMGEREEVLCAKCGCPGERYSKSGEVDWPTT